MAARKRAFNWSNAELEVLNEGVAQHQTVVEARHSAPDTQRKKKCAWQLIATSVNAVGGRERTAHETQKKWSDVKSLTKRKMAAVRRDLTGTGGGPAQAMPLRSVEEATAALIPQVALTGIATGFDSVSLNTSPAPQAASDDDDDSSAENRLPPATPSLPTAAPQPRRQVQVDFISLEQQRLVVEKQRLELEKKRLSVEEQRLEVEKERLERGCCCCRARLSTGIYSGPL